MMMGCSFKLLATVVFLTSLVIGLQVTAEIQCNEVVAQVIPCETFLLSGDASPSNACCSAVQSLDRIAEASPEDRKAICECFKDTARSFPINLDKAQQLPKLCNVAVTVRIDPNVDCASI